MSPNISIKSKTSSSYNKSEKELTMMKRKNNNRMQSAVYPTSCEANNNNNCNSSCCHVHSFSESRSKKATSKILRNKSNKCIQEEDKEDDGAKTSHSNANYNHHQHSNSNNNNNNVPYNKRIANNMTTVFSHNCYNTNKNVMFSTCREHLHYISQSPTKNKSSSDNNNNNNSVVKYKAFSQTQKIHLCEIHPAHRNASFSTSNNYNNNKSKKDFTDSPCCEKETPTQNANTTNTRHYHFATLSSSIKACNTNLSFIPSNHINNNNNNNTNTRRRKDYMIDHPRHNPHQDSNVSSKHSFITKSTTKHVSSSHCNNNNNNKRSNIRTLDIIAEINSKTKQNSNYNNIILLLLSNWGHSEIIGISEVQLIGKNGKKIPIVHCVVSNGKQDTIGRIHNNKTTSVNDMDMWTSPFMNVISIQLYTIKSLCPGQSETLNDIEKIWMWNYNGKDTTKGVKEIEVYQKEELKWKGIVPKGTYPVLTSKFEVCLRNKVYISNCSSQDVTCVSGRNMSPSMENANNNNNNNNYHSCNANNNNNNSHCTFYQRTSGFSSVSKLPKNKNNISATTYTSSSNSNKNYFQHNNNNTNNISYKKHPPLKSNTSSARNKKQNTTETVYSFNSINSNFTKSLIDKPSSSSHDSIPPLSQITPTEFSKTVRHSIMKEHYAPALQTPRDTPSSSSPFITFTKLRIYFISNYGHPSFIGLTGIKFFDNNNDEIVITERMHELGALPKDIHTELNDISDHRTFENLFNGVNDTIDENEMWVTLLHSTNHCPMISATFNEAITVSYVDIWNYNCPIQLDICAKEIVFVFDDDLEHKSYKVLLRKGLGGFDISSTDNTSHTVHQRIYFHNNKTLNTSMKLHLTNIYDSLQFALMNEDDNNNNTSCCCCNSYNIITPILPCGFTFKFILISNWGHNEVISIAKVEFYDYYNQNVEVYSNVKRVNSTFHDYCNDNRKNTMKEKNVNDNVYFEPFYAFTKNENCEITNIVYFVFEKSVGVQYIKIVNPDNGMGVRELQVLLDDNLLFEGTVNKEGESYVVFNSEERFTGKDVVDVSKVVNWNVKKERNEYVKEVKEDGTVVLKLSK